VERDWLTLISLRFATPLASWSFDCLEPEGQQHRRCPQALSAATAITQAGDWCMGNACGP
jgi:hypothetical protein